MLFYFTFAVLSLIMAPGFIQTMCLPQEPLSSLTRIAVSRELDSYSEVCEAFRIVDLLLGFLSLTGGDPTMQLVTYLKDVLKMADRIDHHILKVDTLHMQPICLEWVSRFPKKTG